MKGISTVATAVILATISITLIGTTYLFTSGMMETTMAETFEVIDVFENRIIIRNTGTEPIEELKTLVDGNEIQNDMETIQPGKVGTVTITEDIEAGVHELTVISKSMSQTWAWNVGYVTTTTVVSETSTSSGSINTINTQFNLRKIQKVFKTALKPVSVKSFQVAGRMKTIPDLSNIYKLNFPRDVDINTIIEQYKQNPAVEYVHPNYILEISLIPNEYPDRDALIETQWGLDKIKVPEGWDIETGSPDKVIAVIDTGVDWNHPDLESNIWINEIEANGLDDVDDDENGFVDDVRGYDFVDINTTTYESYGFELLVGEDYTDRDNDPMDFHGHGTHCAGIAGAVTNNAEGVAGVAWNNKIMVVRAAFGIKKNNVINGYLDTDAVIAAIHYAVENGADVISMSFGGSNYSALQDVIDYAYAEDCVLVAAAGNYGYYDYEILYYPAAYDEVIAVAATNSSDGKAYFSSYGDFVDVSAPGVNILSTLFDDTYASKKGTSMATPHVAGLGGLLRSHYPSLSNTEIVQLILNNADNIDALNPGYEGKLGSGRINVLGALCIEYCMGDLNYDNVIDIFDALVFSYAYSSELGDSSWNVNADMNGDDIVDIFDAIIISNVFGNTCPGISTTTTTIPI